MDNHKVELWVKRDDLIHPEISGNKWRKLKYNIQQAREQKEPTLLTFGGAYSNHIAATAAACSAAGIKSIGIIRGEKNKVLNATLSLAMEHGMKIHYVNREDYRQKEEAGFIEKLHKLYGQFYLVPEGGANYKGVLGCAEIVEENSNDFDIVTTACGTGTTLTGLLLSSHKNQKVMGFPALKGGEFIASNARQLLDASNKVETEKEKILGRLELQTDYHFGGYGKVKSELVDFVNRFYVEYNLALDLVYTGKMFFGLFDLIKQGYFKPGTKIMALHTGGLQGNQGMKDRLGIKLNF